MSGEVLAIDPGSTDSAWVLYNGRKPIEFAKQPNADVRHRLRVEKIFTVLAIEYMHPRGMPMSQEEMDTQFWAGRFVEAFGGPWKPVRRMDVKMTLCGHAKARDSNIRQAIIDRFPATGGGKTPQIGTKKEPGPLYGVSKDVWSALAIAITFFEQYAVVEEIG